MREKILEFMKKNKMAEPGDVLCVGFSGGADSVCLLLLLEELSRELAFRLQAVHVNHGLRGAESDGDQEFAEKFCRERGIPLFVYACPVAQMAAESHMGLEEAGRAARRQVFEECVRENGATRIALAHHQNDLAETALFHLARGSSLRGLSSIRPVNGRIIRPLLCVTRREIEQYLKNLGIAWRTDSSNLSVDYTRNIIRHNVIPCLEEQVNERAVLHIAEAAGDLAEADEFLRREAKMRLGRIGRKMKKNGRDAWLLTEELTEEPGILQGYIVLACLEELTGDRRNLTREHVRMARDLMGRRTGKQVNLPYGIEGRRTYEGVLLLKNGVKREPGMKPTKSPEISIAGSSACQVGDCRVSWEIFAGNMEKIPEKTYTKWLDYDRIKNGLVLRTRRKGDYLVINAAGGRKKLKDYMIDCKIPAEERNSVLLLASGSEIIWVVGYRIGESGRVSGGTRQILRIEVTGGNIHERKNPDID